MSAHFAIDLRREQTRLCLSNRWLCLGEMMDQADRVTAAIHQGAARQFVVETNILWGRKQEAKLRFDVSDDSQFPTGNDLFYACGEWVITISKCLSEHKPCFMGRFCHFFRFPCVRSKWLFTQYMFACFQGADGPFCVQAVG